MVSAGLTVMRCEGCRDAFRGPVRGSRSAAQPAASRGIPQHCPRHATACHGSAHGIPRESIKTYIRVCMVSANPAETQTKEGRIIKTIGRQVKNASEWAIRRGYPEKKDPTRSVCLLDKRLKTQAVRGNRCRYQTY